MSVLNMHIIIHSLLFLATVIPAAHAFTNGSLIPAYFCNPKPDGLPKSLGELIPFTVKDQNNALAFNSNASANLNVVAVTNSQPGNTGYMLASFHNTVNRITPIEPGLGVTLANSTSTSLIAGKPNLLILDSLAAGVALDGAMLHARDADGVPVGSFSDTGGVFVVFPGCGKNKEGGWNGVVHSMVIGCNQTYTKLSYHAPKCAPGPITLGGLSVTDNGFGVWNKTFEVSGSECKTNGTTKAAKVVVEELEEVGVGKRFWRV
ncbi:uncharacterized protein LY89DRAFT_681239 [Mollisia scopiformis]|uniref:Uncharacterized protein n=1 Tax=Mollisia scopiformis TaxID=149040 RepID=A0A194XQ41_MOLSC|nr:uncharacterized protein LY89DRAFT_681239 [Mollisia scopiformis]KUJ21862.1 hypothetical protein LY89DRAFT_681239 [Mollisia scopiformis]